MIPTYFALLVCAGGFLASTSTTLYLQVLLCLFGAAASVSLPALGGASIGPAVSFLPFLLARAWPERPDNDGALRVSRATLWLGLVVVWGAISAYAMPRIFAGQVRVTAIDRMQTLGGPSLGFLRPVSGNITQPVYALGSLLTFIAVRTLLARPRRLEVLRDGVIMLAILNCLAAGLNLGQFHLGLPNVLQYVRNGGYSMFEAYETAGMMRIQGTFSEASAFSCFTLQLFAFTFSLWLNKVRTTVTAGISVASLFLMLISTSGTAYVGLSIYLAIVCAGQLWRILSRGRMRRAQTILVVVCATIVLCGFLYIFVPSVTARVSAFFENTVFNKMETKSGIERGTWNRQAWDNLLDTYGLGVGLGSARASSFPLVIASNLGVIGIGLFGAFLLSVLKPSARSADEPIPRAARQSVIAALITVSISGTVFDMGVLFYAFAAAATSGAKPKDPTWMYQDAS